MTRNQIVTFFFLALLIFMFYQMILLFSPFFSAIFGSIILAFAFYPLYVRLNKVVTKPDWLAALIMTIGIILIVAPPCIALVVNLANQAIELYQNITNYIREGNLEKLIDQIRTMPLIQKVESHLFQWDPLKENTTNLVINTSRNIANFSIAQAGVFTKNIFVISLNALFMCFFVFIFLKDGQKIYEFFYQIAPLEEPNKGTIFSQINATFAAVIRGQLLTSLIQSLIAGITYWLLGIPAPIFFAIATFMGTIIPFIGATGVWLPLVIYLFVLQSYAKAIILFLVGLLLISTIDNIIKPALIGKGAKLSYFLLLFGILGGLQIYGIIGAFLGPLILSTFFVLINIYRENYLEEVT